MNELDKLTKKIHTINPNISEELLDLLCEYVSKKNYLKMYDELRMDENFNKLISDIATPHFQLSSK